MTTSCPSCGASASGKFCASCGAALAGATCAACRAPLTPGAKFCHRCGAVAGAAAPAASGMNNAIPWAVAGIALLALIALLAGQRFGRDDAQRPPGATSLSQGRPAMDISSLSSEELAERLYNRVMAASERGRTDTVQFFLPMALQAYQALDSMNVDQRYHLGRLAEVGGDAALAAAQADTILRRQPGHLLGLVLAGRAARMRGDDRAARQYFARIASTNTAERARQLPEYDAHQNDIDVAIGQSKTPATKQ